MRAAIDRRREDQAAADSGTAGRTQHRREAARKSAALTDATAAALTRLKHERATRGT